MYGLGWCGVADSMCALAHDGLLALLPCAQPIHMKADIDRSPLRSPTHSLPGCEERPNERADPHAAEQEGEGGGEAQADQGGRCA